MDVTSSIVNLAVKVHNFELRAALVSLVERDQFSGHPVENPSMNLHNILAKYDTIKPNVAPTDAIQLQLFPFSVKDRARDWLQNKDSNAFTTWDTLFKAFLNKYFPPGKDANLRADVTSFSQQHGESLYDCLLYTSPSPRDGLLSRMPSSA